MEFIDYISENFLDIILHLGNHIVLVAGGITLALIIGVPLGIIAYKVSWLSSIIMFFANTMQLIPSIAMLAILMYYFGLGNFTMIIGICLYSLLPIIRNTFVGIKEVKESIVEAGRGIGMTNFQILRKIQIPISIPFILAGIRIAVVIAISVACLGPYIGGDGLGVEIISGINMLNHTKIFAGVIPAAILAIFADLILGRYEKKLKAFNAEV